MYDRVKNFRKNRKKLLADCLGGKCAKCGYCDCLPAMDFHHIDESQKEFIVSRKIESLHKCVEEVKKCVLLCCRCHRELHDGLWNIEDVEVVGFDDKVLEDYINRSKVTKRCELCNKEFVVKSSSKKRFCEERCKRLKSRKVQRPTKETLQEEIEHFTWVALGKRYGVSDNAVRKWARTYNLI